MRKGELQTTQDINQKFSMGVLKGDEVWALERNTSSPTNKNKEK